MNDEQIKHMVSRFLGWTLPADFDPDGGIKYTRHTDGRSPPVGTNLFSAAQADEMIRFITEGLPQ